MTIATVAADDPVTASAINQLIANVNASPGVAIITSNTTWAVPNGVHKFRVSICGGGGSAGELGSVISGEDSYSTPGGPGGDSVARRIWVAGADIGTSYSITIGAGGGSGLAAAGGSSSFGTLLTVSGGGAGASDSTTANVAGTKGAPGTVTAGSLSGSALAIGNDSVAVYNTPHNIPQAFGHGGLRTSDAGAPGIVVIEW